MDFPVPDSCRPAVADESGRQSWAIGSALQGRQFDGHRLRPSNDNSSGRLADDRACSPNVLALDRNWRINPSHPSVTLVLAAENDLGAAEICQALRQRGSKAIIRGLLDPS